MIKAEGLKKSYSGRCVLDVESFVFEPGRRYALIGANGSGKSTFLRILSGALKPDEGQVLRESGSELMGYMPQHPYLFGFSVLKNVMLAIPQRNGRREKAEAALVKVGMDRLSKAGGHTLSGGEAQRTAFARMIALPRPLLLLDEPTSAMDIAAGDNIEEQLLDYCRENNCTLIMATHSLAQAARVADTILYFDAGHICESGATKQLLENPQTESCRVFLRHWNVQTD